MSVLLPILGDLKAIDKAIARGDVGIAGMLIYEKGCQGGIPDSAEEEGISGATKKGKES